MTRVYFETDAFIGQELLAVDVPALQAFFDDNPEYFYQINDRPPRADEAQSEFDEQVPAHLPHGERWFIGVRERETRSMVAMVNVTAHLGVRHVWHVGLFIVATHLHGQDPAAGIPFGQLQVDLPVPPRVLRSRRTERVGKTPKELLAGQPHAHSLELLGFQRFAPA